MPLNLGTTGIGSHPLTDPRQIILDIFESGITHPYIPQLSSDEMIGQFHGEVPGLSIQKGTAILDLTKINFESDLKAFKTRLKMQELLFEPHGMEIEAPFFQALYMFPELLKKASNPVRGIKCQITGPITEAASIKIHPGGEKLIRNEELFEVLVNYAAEIAHWLSSFLLRIARDNGIAASNVILFLDEPLFPLSVEKEIPYEAGLKMFSRVLQLIQCKKGIHICDNPITVVDSILNYPIDLFSYDANSYPDSLKNTNIEVLDKYVKRGGGFAFGITPNTPETLFGVHNIPDIIKMELPPEQFFPTPDELIHILQKNIHPLSQKDIPIKTLLSNSLITPACGFRNFNIPTVAQGEKIVVELLKLQELAAQKVRNTYQLL